MKIIHVVNVLLVLAILYGAYTIWTYIDRRSGLVGTEAPSFTAFRLSNSQTLFIEPRIVPGKQVFFVFSADCHICVDVARFLNTHYGDPDDKVKIFGLSMYPQQETARFMNTTPTSFPVILIGSEFLEKYSITGTPTTYLIEDGIIELEVIGKPTTNQRSYINKFFKGE